jgi:hypothetical protein
MAVSPLVTTSMATTGTTTLRQKTLAISTKPTEEVGSPMSNPSEDEDTGDLAEQMNTRNRRNFVKGINNISTQKWGK